MANEPKTLLMRRATVLGQVTPFSIQPFPELPQSFLARFPELKQHEDDKKKWLQNLCSTLATALASAKTKGAS